MAISTYHRPVSQAVIEGLGGDFSIVGVSSTLIVTTNGPYSVTLNGSFNSNGIGRATSITYSYDNAPYLTFSGFSLNTTDTYGATTLFRGNDRINGSWGNDIFYISQGNDDYYARADR